MSCIILCLNNRYLLLIARTTSNFLQWLISRDNGGFYTNLIYIVTEMVTAMGIELRKDSPGYKRRVFMKDTCNL